MSDAERRERARLRSERWRRVHGIMPRRPAQRPWLADGVSRSAWYRRRKQAAERAIHTAKRKEIREAQHPERRHGGAPGKGRGKGKQSRQVGDSVRDARFTKETASKTGKSERTVQRNAARGRQADLDKVVNTTLDRASAFVRELQDELAEIARCHQVMAAIIGELSDNRV